MLRRSFIGMFVCAAALASTVAGVAQVKVMNPPKVVDINTAPEADIAALGIDKAVARKVVEGRPYRNKRDLLTRQLLTKEQYEKLKDLMVAKQVAKK